MHHRLCPVRVGLRNTLDDGTADGTVLTAVFVSLQGFDAFAAQHLVGTWVKARVAIRVFASDTFLLLL